MYACMHSVHAGMLKTRLCKGWGMHNLSYLAMHRRIVRNRKEQADMHRRWIQVLCVTPCTHCAISSAPCD